MALWKRDTLGHFMKGTERLGWWILVNLELRWLSFHNLGVFGERFDHDREILGHFTFYIYISDTLLWHLSLYSAVLSKLHLSPRLSNSLLHFFLAFLNSPDVFQTDQRLLLFTAKAGQVCKSLLSLPSVGPRVPLFPELLGIIVQHFWWALSWRRLISTCNEAANISVLMMIYVTITVQYKTSQGLEEQAAAFCITHLINLSQSTITKPHQRKGESKQHLPQKIAKRARPLSDYHQVSFNVCKALYRTVPN